MGADKRGRSSSDLLIRAIREIGGRLLGCGGAVSFGLWQGFELLLSLGSLGGLAPDLVEVDQRHKAKAVTPLRCVTAVQDAVAMAGALGISARFWSAATESAQSPLSETRKGIGMAAKDRKDRKELGSASSFALFWALSRLNHSGFGKASSFCFHSAAWFAAAFVALDAALGVKAVTSLRCVTALQDAGALAGASELFAMFRIAATQRERGCRFGEFGACSAGEVARSSPRLLVAAAILAAVEPRHPARRDWRPSFRELGTSSAIPGGKMRGLNGGHPGRRYTAVNGLGLLGGQPCIPKLLEPLGARA